MPSPAAPIDHAARYAARAEQFRPSAVRSVYELAKRPGMISLAGGNPDLTGLPTAQIAGIAESLIRGNGVAALQYGGSAGHRPLAELVCELMALEGIDAAPEQPLMTVGSQHGLELVGTLFCDPGDVILAEAPTYAGALSAFRSMEARVEHTPIDEHGLIPERLAERIAELTAAGTPPKFLYTIPNFNNPSGVTLSPERRQRVVDVCRAAGLLIVEDNPYGLLRFDGELPPALQSLDPENVCYLGSFSKIFAPGVRLGWALAPAAIRARMALAVEASVVCPAMLSQHLTAAFFASIDWRARLRELAAGYAAKAAAAQTALRDFLPSGTGWTAPAGGFFLWVTLPAELPAPAVIAAAVEEGVVVIPGTGFAADGSGGQQLRLSFSNESVERIREGVRRLGAACDRVAGE